MTGDTTNLSTPPGRRIVFYLAFWSIAFIAAFLFAEISVRVIGRTDLDGTFYFRDEPIPPFRISVEQTTQFIQEYLADQHGYMAWDSELGWTNRPNTCTKDRMYCTNSEGLRADRDYDTTPLPGVTRIAFIGDSFIHGHDVPFADSLEPLVESRLEARGLKVEALNFGVGGFGMDQSYLRYLRDARRLNPDIVVFGLQMENVARHVNVLRPIYFPGSRIPFSKPRFVIRDGDVAVMNQPTIPPAKIPDVMAHFYEHPLHRYEFFYDESYVHHWYQRSRLFAVLDHLVKKRFESGTPGKDPYDPDGEAMKITLAILERLSSETSKRGEKLYFLYLPTAESLAAYESGGKDPLRTLIERVRERYDVIDPTPPLLDACRQRGIPAVIPGHFSPIGNAIIADVLADALAPAIRTETVDPSETPAIPDTP